MTIEENLRTLQLNLIAPVTLTHPALPGMLRRGILARQGRCKRGSVITVNSLRSTSQSRRGINTCRLPAVPWAAG